MKALVIVLISLTLSSVSFGQKNDTLINKYNAKGKKHGKWITYEEFEGDSLKTVSIYSNGVLNGTLCSYFPNSQLMCEIQYKNGVHYGRAKYYYKNGAISDIYYYEKGEVKSHIKFMGSGEIFQETDNGKVIQYEKGIPIKK